MPAEMLSAELPASSFPTEAPTDPKGIGLSVAASNSIAVNSQRDASITQQRYESTELGRTPDEALGAREPAQNLGVSPPPSPLLAAAGQPPAPVPLPQSGAPGARNYLDIIRSPAPTRPSSPASLTVEPSVEPPHSFQSAVSRDPPSGASVAAETAATVNSTYASPSPGNGACRAGGRAGSDSDFLAPVGPASGTPPDASLVSPITDDVAAEAAAAGKAGGTFNADSAGKEASISLTFEILGKEAPVRLVRDVEQLMQESFDEWPTVLCAVLKYRRGYRMLVALNEQRELLAACWFVSCSDRHLNYLYCPAFATRREFRGQGIGEAMMTELKAIADGGRVLIAAELGSVALWQRWGFRRCREVREDREAWALDATYGVFTRASTRLMRGKTRAEVAYRDRCWDQYYSGLHDAPNIDSEGACHDTKPYERPGFTSALPPHLSAVSLETVPGSDPISTLASPPIADGATTEAAAAATSPPRRRDALLHRLAHVFCLNTLLPERL
ncbi:hypothetical protein EMIHUDRAFT_227996 [Emiliania huxleyi CCMP1516]|uniref:N-acetyltransferase domain-containing protein n=2 Tax=Emiliania huxleyi TaxID=2903 RepID=A0A0D3KGT4_EMIH1|nr:hypothetical protein EMIHUDRAFT_227996 [Emiliania huxleyi CCMP1516]EOD34969.1 hypothetical protein EMIHUDRAFT_227996 [Emiliania huxleyi CCMP1516]|eukprot:XP_005787398.1 hypothetical protein EMIHUDRAFT_227996 [Emiliania huxleyi CCMP1516]